MKSFKFEIESDYKTCDYCERTHFEYDTGYAEYGCSLLGNVDENPCWGDFDCPLCAKVEVELD